MADIARRLDCDPAYVRATFRRRKWKSVRKAQRVDHGTVLADYRRGDKYIEIAIRHSISQALIAYIVRRNAPDLTGLRKRGPRTAPAAMGVA
jgi:hypothetical protein